MIKMALIDCPECKKKVSDQSISCPQCGYPIKTSFVGKAQSIPAKSQIKKDGTPSPFMIVLGIFILIAAIATCSNDNSSSSYREKSIFSVSQACTLFNTEMTAWKSSNNDDIYRCISNYLDVSPETNNKMANNVAYYVEGSFDTVKEVKIVLNVNNTKYKTQSTNEFLKMVDTLYSQLNNKTLPSEIQTAIKDKKGLENSEGELIYIVEYTKNDSGYTQKFIIR